jgi:hypothetical protein
MVCPRRPNPPQLSRFVGEICGVGTASGYRIVIGRWELSPFGEFADVMLESPDGLRTLLAPRQDIAAYVGATYTFDRVEVVPVTTERGDDVLKVDAGRLQVVLTFGSRSPVGRLLRVVPRSVATARWWATIIDPLARLVLRGVRTRGSAAGDRREWYGATDARRIIGLRARLDDADLGDLGDVWPPVRFGFGSTPKQPMAVKVVSTVHEGAA